MFPVFLHNLVLSTHHMLQHTYNRTYPQTLLPSQTIPSITIARIIGCMYPIVHYNTITHPPDSIYHHPTRCLSTYQFTHHIFSTSIHQPATLSFMKMTFPIHSAYPLGRFHRHRTREIALRR